MKMLKASTLVAAVVGLALAAPAMAQKPSNLALEIGGNYITKSDVRDAVGDLGLRVALNYQLPSLSLLGPETGGKPSVTLAYNYADDDVKLTTWGLTYEERVPFSVVGRSGGSSPYWGLGLGLFRHEAKFDYHPSAVDVSVAAENGSEKESKTRFGGRAIIGMDFNSKWYTELSYNLTGKVADGRTDSLALAAGFRF